MFRLAAILAICFVAINLVYSLDRFYEWGDRVTGDDVAYGFSSKHLKFNELNSMTLTIKYPPHGVGVVISYVKYTVGLSWGSILNRPIITDGGIGQRNITIFAEPLNTTELFYHAEIFGSFVPQEN